jgi:hypothetical protein
MSKHVTISPKEAADRLAIRELVEAYAHCADRRDSKGQMSLFTENTRFVVYMNAKDPTPSQPTSNSGRGVLASRHSCVAETDARKKSEALSARTRSSETKFVAMISGGLLLSRK